MATKPAHRNGENSRPSARHVRADRDYADAETRAVRASPVFRRLLARARRDAAQGKVYPADDVMAAVQAPAADPLPGELAGR